MKSIPLLAACALTAAAATAQTVEAPPAAAAAPGASSPIGGATRHWLALQRGGSHAGTAHPVSGEVATLVYRRYLDSFRAPGGSPAATAGAATGTTSSSGDAGRSR